MAPPTNAYLAQEVVPVDGAEEGVPLHRRGVVGAAAQPLARVLHQQLWGGEKMMGISFARSH